MFVSHIPTVTLTTLCIHRMHTCACVHMHNAHMLEVFRLWPYKD